MVPRSTWGGGPGGNRNASHRNKIQIGAWEPLLISIIYELGENPLKRIDRDPSAFPSNGEDDVCLAGGTPDRKGGLSEKLNNSNLSSIAGGRLESGMQEKDGKGREAGMKPLSNKRGGWLGGTW